MKLPAPTQRRLTVAMLKAIYTALDAALAGEWDGGDFEGMKPEDFERARSWAEEQISKRHMRKLFK